MIILTLNQKSSDILIVQVSKPFLIKIFLRGMHNSRRVVIRATQTTLPKNPSAPSQRTFLVEAGRMRKPIEQQQPSVGVNLTEQVQSDTSGNHGIAIVTVCEQNQCHNRDCYNKDREICPLLQGNKECKEVRSATELAGNLTKKIPNDKQGVKLDDTNFKGENNPQHLVTEKTTVPINRDKDFKPSEKQTDYVAQPHIGPKIASSLPPTSIYHQKDTTNHDAPKDDE